MGLTVTLTGSYETGRIAQAEVRFEWPNSILVRSAREERERASIRFLSSMSVDNFQTGYSENGRGKRCPRHVAEGNVVGMRLDILAIPGLLELHDQMTLAPC